MKNYYETNQMHKEGYISDILMPDESIIWSGTPKKSAFVINTSARLFPIAFLWLLIDSFFIISILKGNMIAGPSVKLVIIPFFILHLFPVWLWFGQIITSFTRWKNTEYAVTNKRIIIRNGFIGYDYKSVYYTEINNIHLHVGLIDKLLKVGDIRISLADSFEQSLNPTILDIEEPNRVYKLIQKAVLDIQTDIHYPNALRPEHNPGYQTKYQPENN